MKHSSANTLSRVLRQRAERHPQKLALIDRDRQWSYGDFQREVDRIANGFLRVGVQKGDKVALILPNCAEFLFSIFATAHIGAVFVPLNTAYTAEEAEYVLRHSEASLVLTTQQFLPLLREIRSRLGEVRNVIVTDGDAGAEALPWNTFVAGLDDRAPALDIAADDLASITYTSGTTDRPKGVMLSQDAYAFAPRMRAEGLGWSENDRVLCLLPLFHVNALCHMCIAMLSVGGSIVLTERFSASRFWDEVRHYGATTSSLMRTIPQILLSQPQRPDDQDNPLRLVVALLSAEMHARFEQRFDLVAVPSYSLTEDILSVIGPLDKQIRKLGSCGLPLAPEVHRLRIVDEAGNTMPAVQPGEIVKQSPAIMKGYFKNPEATARALKDGWLYTGDLGYIDEDGFLYFVDRLKDIVRRGDENISSEEVESVLNAHPQIAESAVVGVRDEIRGEEVKAYIVLKPPATPGSAPPEAIWAFCKQHLAPFKIPRFIEYRAELPKTPSSKIQKNLLRRENSGAASVVFDRLAQRKVPEPPA